MARLPDNSVLIAHKAIGLASGFSGETRRVATAILDHFNHKTGRCDPSNERIAGLLGISMRMVRKATKELCETAKPLFVKRSHGGHSHCASYEPQWETFQAIVADWNSAMKGVTRDVTRDSANRNKRSCSTGTNVPVEQEQTFLQTSRRNQTKEPLPPHPLPGVFPPNEKTGVVSSSIASGKQPAPTQQRQGRKGLRNEGASPQRQGYLVHAIAGGRSASREEAAEAAAWRRIIDPVRKSNAELAYRIYVEATSEMLAEATGAEVARRGAGLRCLLNALDEEALRARRTEADRGSPSGMGPSGPPPPAGAGRPGISVCDVKFIAKA